MKLHEMNKTGTFVIIDDWNHRLVETLPRHQAISKYGDCEVASVCTSGISNEPDEDGFTPSWKSDVWVKIPGMMIGSWNGANMHLLFIGTDTEATLVGKKSGQLITIYKHGWDDFSAWWRDVSEKDNESAGFSVRGSAKDIIKELEGEI